MIFHAVEISRLEEDKNIEGNIIKDVRNLLKLKKLKRNTNDAANKGIGNLFRLKKENKAINYRILCDIRNLLEHEEANYYKPVKINNFCNNNYIEYKSKSY